MRAVLALLLIFSGLEVAYLVISGKLSLPGDTGDAGSSGMSPPVLPKLPGGSSNMFMGTQVPGANTGSSAGGIQFL